MPRLRANLGEAIAASIHSLAGAEFHDVHSALTPLASPPWRCSSRNRAAKRFTLCFTGLVVGPGLADAAAC